MGEERELENYFNGTFRIHQPSMSNDAEMFKRTFARLKQELPGCEFFESFTPFHSSYGAWHYLGKCHSKNSLITRKESSGSSSTSRPGSTRTKSDYDHSTASDETGKEREVWIVARVSQHALKAEREYKLLQKLCANSDPECHHFVKPLHYTRLPVRESGDQPLSVVLAEAPGRNYLREVVEFGPNFYQGSPESPQVSPGQQVPLLLFLDFAIGASECCEILHHGNEIVHGEIRSDAFHFNRDQGHVRMVNLGTGARSFEHGLTSAGWSSLMHERGVQHKLQFIAPEQTGRLPAEPDARTDVYSLGILFWTMLTGQPVFEGNSALDIMQNVLGRRAPQVSSVRTNIPEAISAVIAKMTSKNMDDRYNSSSGVKHDFIAIRKILIDADTHALNTFKIAQNDVSCFFTLPTHLVGREEQKQRILDVAEKAARRIARAAPITRKGLFNLSSGASTFSGDRIAEISLFDDILSDSTSSGERGERESSHRDSRLNSIPESGQVDLGLARTKTITQSQRSTGSSTNSVIDENDFKPLAETKSLVDSSKGSHPDSSGPQRTVSSHQLSNDASSLLRTAQRLKRKGRCEVIGICGAAGHGKSSLVQSVAPTLRRHGYFTSAKFDQAQHTPFEPVVKVMSSLFRQIFSEQDINTQFHENVRTFVRPFWGLLHSYLELPVWLLSSTSDRPLNAKNPATAAGINNCPPEKKKMKMCSQQSTSEWLQKGGAGKNSKFGHIFLDVLRLLAMQKFICFCLDDLQFADNESLDLLNMIISAHIPIVLIVSYRAEDAIPRKIKHHLDRGTRVTVGPFRDDETAQYAADTLHREKEYCMPLVAVVQEKTQGNPFFVREIMDSAYRKKAIYYCWKCSKWEFNIDRLFEQFASPDSGRFSSNDFIVRRMKDLSIDAQTLLAWASIVGNTFSYSLMVRVMACDCSKASPKELIPPTSKDPVAGLQEALQAYIIMPTDDENRFRFSHDRYVAAARSLCEQYVPEEMHFVIACAMMKHEPFDPVNHASNVLFEQARHICEGLEVFKMRQQVRLPARSVLYNAAEDAQETGARSSALRYLEACVALLQEDAWTDGEDASYAETLTLHTQVAEAHWYLNTYEHARNSLGQIFANARSPVDSTPASMICSRISAQMGDTKSAFGRLKRSLTSLGVEMEDMTDEECDEEFHRLAPLLQERIRGIDFASRPPLDRRLATLGALLIEVLSTSFWMDAQLFYRATLKMMSLFLEEGIYPQVGLGLVHFATVAVYRFNLIQMGVEFGDTSLQFFDAFEGETYTRGRGLTLHALLLGHLQKEMPENFAHLQRGLESASLAGDKMLHVLNTGIVASYRLWCSENLAEIEAYIGTVAEDWPDWHENMRGGAFLMAVRQYVRALQGKTNSKSAKDVLSDEHHSSEEYTRWIATHASHPTRPLSVYNSYRLVALYRFGHHKEALELAESLVEVIGELWSMRFTYQCFYYLCLLLLGSIREDPKRADRDKILARVAHFRARIEVVSSINPVNYATWLKLIDAETADVTGNYGQVLGFYEGAVNHAVVHGFIVDEALSLELYGDWLERKGASRPARASIVDSIAAYRRTGAFGKADQVSERYSFLLYGTRSLSTMDAGTQTEIADADPTTSYQLEKIATHQDGHSSAADRTQAWLDPQHAAVGPQLKKEVSATGSLLGGGLSAVGLDMIDLASILESSQLLSSELNVDSLLSKLTEIIVDSTGADLCGIVVEGDNSGWCVAATGTQEGIPSPPSGISLDEVDDPIGKSVTLYVLRFKEQVFLRNLLDDERFSNVPQSWRDEHPEGASAIALPILHGDNVLLGSLYCQAPPNIFTERTVTLLKLLVNQIAISIANALLFKRVEKVSASNSSMLEVQRQALAQAQKAEKKAKAAELEAKEMVRLKDEAAKAKSMFLANVSHELRTPLNGVIGMSEMLKATRLNKEQEEHADSIRVCADTLLSVINDILDFSKLEAGKMQIFSVQISLSETIHEVVRALSYTNMERHLETVEELELDSSLIVMGDPVRLHQLLMNLISNAYKFTSKGSVTVRAKVDHETAEMLQVTISVTDTGIGISDEQQKKLFLPFSQADSSTARSYGGTGLGLSICKAIIENVMNGKIWLESTPGVGTTVSFSLPFKKVIPTPGDPSNGKVTPHGGREADPMSIFTPPAEADGDAGSSRRIVSLAGIPRDQLKVCIAEDNPINQKIAINFVKKLGFTCEAYGDGQQAVDALGRASADGHPFHLVLMDVQMPVLDGYNATREIRKHPDARVKDILVIAMTASAIRGDREKCLEAGMNNYLAKPVRADTLKQMLESYLQQSTRAMPDLQAEADRLVGETLALHTSEREGGGGGKENAAAAAVASPVVDGGGGGGGRLDPASAKVAGSRGKSPRPKSPNRGFATEIHLKPEEMVQKVKEMPAAQKLKEKSQVEAERGSGRERRASGQTVSNGDGKARANGKVNGRAGS